jgi:hypothetical protein
MSLTIRLSLAFIFGRTRSFQKIPGFIPSAEVVDVAGGPYDSFIQIVELRWLGRNFIAFAADLQACGKEVIQQHTVSVGG